ncbi:MAG TPA: sensor histidine kinase [Rectinemataceae bacterium]|nr:sensor histidine kinase [Rectinemataceae bacterium]
MSRASTDTGARTPRSRRSLGFRYRLLLYFAAVISLPLLTLGVAAPLVYSRDVERSATDHTGQMIGQVARSVELYVQDVEKVLDFVAASPQVLAFLHGSGPGGASAVLDAIHGSRPELAGLLVLSAGDRLASPDFYRISTDPLSHESWYSVAAGSPDRVALTPRPVGRNVRVRMGPSADEVVMVSKAVVDRSTGQVIGVAAADLDLSVVRGLLSEAKVGADGFLFIVDAALEPVLAPVNPVLYRVSPRWIADSPSGTVKRIHGIDYQVLARLSAYTGWRTVGVFSRTEAFREASFVRYSALITGGLTVAVALVLSILLSSSVAGPVIELETLMGRAEAGDLSARFVGNTDDEVGRLGRSYNTMITEIRNLIDLVYTEQRDKREAELRILQEQIKPHFLYNTLETIRFMAKRRGATDVAEMVSALTKLFRIGLSRGQETVPLRDELEHVRSYLFIQSSRYAGKFGYEVEAEPDCLELRVQRLILQPLAENAIYHGVRERHGSGSIRIDAAISGGLLSIRVRDDGAGMDDVRLEAVRSVLENRRPLPGTASGYGIYNVNERVRSYGPEYGLAFESEPGLGTTVTILHPVIREEEGS